MHPRAAGLLATVALVAAVGLAACAEDEADAPTTSPTGTATSAPSPTAGASESPTTSDGDSPTASPTAAETSPAGAAAEVNRCTREEAEDFSGDASVTVDFGNELGERYVPSCIAIEAGTEIVFSGPFEEHPLVNGTLQGFERVPTPGPIPETDEGTEARVTLEEPGVYPFYCDIHAASGMVGVVYVE